MTSGRMEVTTGPMARQQRQPRNTTDRDRHRKLIARGKPPCHICGHDIDYTADWLDPMSFTIDHIIPLAKNGPDTLDNLGPAHRGCNRAKSDSLVDGQEGVEYITHRRWIDA